LIHAGTPGFGFGWIGVDLFFVLSGFLITTLLCQEIASTGGIHYGYFLIRRALRLMPAYFFYALLITLCIWFWPGSVRSTAEGWSPMAYTLSIWGYFINFVPQKGIWNGQPLTVHLWSLAVEQQYYVLWPMVLLLMKRRLPALVRMSLLISLVFGIAYVSITTDWKYHMIFTRGFVIVFASSLAIAAARDPNPFKGSWMTISLGFIGLLGFLGMGILQFYPKITSLNPFDLLPLVIPAITIFVIRLWYFPDWGSLIRKLLQHPIMVYLGKVSYGIYLYHEMVRVAVWWLLKPLMLHWPAGLGFSVRLMIYICLSIAFASLSYEKLEKPFLKMGKKFRS
jgi:peptidoglycan/LPS O-acetylase OafA/YrhL